MAKKILMSFMAVTFLGILGNLFLVIKLGNVDRTARELLDLQQAVDRAAHMGELVELERERLPRCLLRLDSAECSEIPASAARFAADVEEFKATPAFRSEDLRAILNNLVHGHNTFLDDFTAASGRGPALAPQALGRLTGTLETLAAGIARFRVRLTALQEDQLGAMDAGMVLINRTMVGLILLMGFLSTILCVFITRGILGPLRRLLFASRQIGQGDFDPAIETGRADEEIAELIEAFQEMGRRLQKYQARQADLERLRAASTIAAGVSHEVNNPLTVITGAAEFLRLSKGGGDPELREGLSLIIDEVQRISDITQKLSHLKQFVVENYSLGGEAGKAPGNLLDIAGSARGEEP